MGQDGDFVLADQVDQGRIKLAPIASVAKRQSVRLKSDAATAAFMDDDFGGHQIIPSIVSATCC
jgi:hypothetical protein